MSYLITTVLLLALWHLVYESIVAPTFRLQLRFKLLALRDELRRLRITGALGDEHFHFLQGSINTLITALHRFDLPMLASVYREYARNGAFRARCDARSKLLDDCNVPEVREIRRRSLQLASMALAVNSGAWAIYLVPVMLATLGYSAVKTQIRASLSLSESDFQLVAPAGAVACR